MAHIWEHGALELQNMAGSDVSFGKTRSAGPPGHYNMVFQYQQKDVGLEAARISRQLLLSLLPQELQAEFEGEIEEEFDFEEERDALSGAVRTRPLPTADPGHHHQQDAAHRSRDFLRQGGYPQPAARPRFAGAAAAACTL
jgi:hypothetical protein